MATGDRNRRNGVVLVALFAVVFAMVGLSYAAVPLYSLFCRVTGFGGTTQVADRVADEVLDRTVRVRFTADVDRGLPWAFAPETREIELRIGEPGLVYYEAENLGATASAGAAVYNVVPAKAGVYFYKVQCFCFDDQTLAPGQRARLAVYFFVDPAMADDPGLDEVRTITLSYTFFRSQSYVPDDAIEGYDNAVEQAMASTPATAIPAR